MESSKLKENKASFKSYINILDKRYIDMPIFLRSFSESTKQKKMFYLYAENSICGIITTMIKSDQEYKKNKKKNRNKDVEKLVASRSLSRTS